MDDQHLGVLDPSCPVNWEHLLNTGLAGCWMVPPNSGWRGGLTLRDLVRGGHATHDGTLTNGPTWAGARGRPGGYGSLSLDAASSQKVVIDGTIPSMVNTLVCSFGYWAKTTQASNGWIVAPANSGNDSPYFALIVLGGSTGVADFAWRNLAQSASGDITGTSAVNDGKWHHLFLTANGTTGYVYVDGKQEGSGTAPSGTFGFDRFRLGVFDRPSTLGFYTGGLDDVRFYNRALSASEVLALYDQSRRGHPDTLRWLSSRAFFLPPAAGGGTSYNLTATDSLSSSESVVRMAAEVRSASDALTAAGSLARAFAGGRTAVDALTSSESLTKLFVGVRVAVDSLTLSESAVRTAAEVRATTDAMSAAESVARVFVGSRATIDALASSDVGARTDATVRSTADAISSAESAVRAFTGFRTAVDSLSLAESPTRAFTGSRTTIDALSLSESTVKVFVGARLASDALSVAESLARAFAGSRTTVGALTVSEIIEALSGKLATATDSLSSSESLARAFAGARSVADALALAESAVRALVLICTTADSLTSSESLARLHTVARSASDSLSWVDSADATSAGKVRSAADGLVVAGAVTRVFAGSRATSDALAAALAAVGTVSTLTSPDYLIGKVTVCSLVSGVVTVQPLVSGTLTVNPR